MVKKLIAVGAFSILLAACGDDSSSATGGDSEKNAVSLDSLVGYTQKGPFLKGSTVYLYELSDGRTLKQTNGNFTSDITRDDGRYKFTARDLVSQYAMVVVDGYYRNEVTGESSNAPIRLKSITDLRKRSSVNVNILTHLEYDRVYQLVTRDGMTVKEAKRTAQAEILKLFGIELDENTDAESMDVFGASDADAALLAISVLLQGDRKESEMKTLLSEISDAITENGKWEGASAEAMKTQMADWAFSHDLQQIRKNVEGWGLNKNGEVGNFERLIENFIAGMFGLDTCRKDEDIESQFRVENGQSSFNGKQYRCMDGMFVTRYEDSYFEDKPYDLMLDPRDRRVYRTVKIGDQVWMAENLNLDYKVKLKGSDEYETYGNYPEGDKVRYGRFYSWGAAMDSAGVYSNSGKGCGNRTACTPTYPVRGICPEGWHLPSNDDWETLFEAVGGKATAGKVLKTTTGWHDGYGTDEFLFAAVGAGGAGLEDHEADFWTSVPADDASANFVSLYIDSDAADLHNDPSDYSMSVRCVKDSE